MFFFDNPSNYSYNSTAPGPGATGTLIITPNTSAATTAVVRGSGANFLLGTFTTNTTLPTTVIVGGVWDINVWLNASSNGSTFYATIYTGTGTLLGSGQSNPVPLINTGTQVYTQSIYVPTTTLLSNDSIVIRLYASLSSGASKTVTFYTRDNTPSHVHTTLIVNSGTGPTGPAGSNGTYGISSSGITVYQSGSIYSTIRLNNAISTVFLMQSSIFTNGVDLYGMDATNPAGASSGTPQPGGRYITLINAVDTVNYNIRFQNQAAAASTTGLPFYLPNNNSTIITSQGSITFLCVNEISPGYWVPIAYTGNV